MAARSRRILALFGVTVIAVVLVDSFDAVKPSPVTAATCTALLFASAQNPAEFLSLHRDQIRAAATAYDLPASLVAAVIADHLRQQTPFRNFTDCAGSALGANLSLGPGQLRLSTAAALQGASFPKLSASAYRELRAQLMSPEKNIDLTARELRALLERSHRYPGMNSTELLQAPQAMALAVSEYRMGRSSAPRESAKLSINAFGTLSMMQSGELDYLETGREGNLPKTQITEYLRHIHCESGIFNQSACSEWITSQKGRSPRIFPKQAL